MEARGDNNLRKARVPALLEAIRFTLINCALVFVVIIWIPAYNVWVGALLVATGFCCSGLAFDAFRQPVQYKRGKIWAELAPVTIAVLADWLASFGFLPWPMTVLLLNLLGAVVGWYMRSHDLYRFANNGWEVL